MYTDHRHLGNYNKMSTRCQQDKDSWKNRKESTTQHLPCAPTARQTEILQNPVIDAWKSCHRPAAAGPILRSVFCKSWPWLPPSAYLSSMNAFWRKLKKISHRQCLTAPKTQMKNNTAEKNMKKVLLPVAIYTSMKGGFQHHWALCKAAHCQSQGLALCFWWFSRWQLENLARSRLAGHRHHRVIAKSQHLIIRMAVVRASTKMLSRTNFSQLRSKEPWQDKFHQVGHYHSHLRTPNHLT